MQGTLSLRQEQYIMTCYNSIVSTPMLVTSIPIASFDRSNDDLSRCHEAPVHQTHIRLICSVCFYINPRGLFIIDVSVSVTLPNDVYAV